MAFIIEYSINVHLLKNWT